MDKNCNFLRFPGIVIGGLLPLLGLVLMGVVVGCSKTEEKNAPPVAEQTGAVVVTVDGVVLTERELSARADLVGRLVQNRKPNTTVADLKKRRDAFCKVYPQAFVEDVVLSNYFAREKLELPEAMITNFQARAVKAYGIGKKKTYAALKTVAGELADRLEAEILLEVRRQYAEDIWVARHPTNLPPTYVEDVLKSIHDYNARMALTNAFVFAQATNVWNQLKGGASFAELVKTYSAGDDDEKEEGGAWDSMDLTQLQEEPELKKWFKLGQAKVGEFSPPIECDAGLSIVRYDGTDNGEEGDEPTEYKFSRIHFLLPMFMEPDTPENIIATAKKEHAQRLFRQKLAELVKAAQVVYTPKPEVKAEKKSAHGDSKAIEK